MVSDPYFRTQSALWMLGSCLFISYFLAGCSIGEWDKTLPSSLDLGSPRSYRTVRTMIHLHSPVSYDACDSGNPNCLQHLRLGLCRNHVDFAFLTDHPNRMASTEFADLQLTLAGAGDTAIQESGQTIGNRLVCEDQHEIQVMAGYEDQLMPIGMTQHLDPDPATRLTLYEGKTPALVARLKAETDAIVFVPHTESRTLEHLKSLLMDGIEIYNLHANVNPQMRHDFLGFDFFSGTMDMLIYLADPYGKHKPDLAFLYFMKVSPTYAQKWDQLIAAGFKVIGIGGDDSHQNFFPGNAADDERVDSHRRLMRWVTHHFLVKDKTLAEMKQAIRAGRGWVVFEGLGSPTGMDFYVETDSSTKGVGETVTWAAGKTTLRVDMPRLHASSPKGSTDPFLVIRLIHVNTDGTETVVATSINASLSYSASSTGAYRAEVSMVPLHFKDFIRYKPEVVHQEMKWIITNHIYLQ